MNRFYKKAILSAILISFSCLLSFSQIKVSENGNVGIKFDNVPQSSLVLNHIGNSGFAAYFYSPTKTSGGGLMVEVEKSGGLHFYGISGYNKAGSGYNYGVKGTAYISTQSSGRNYGVQGYAGNGSTGWNYGVYGRILGSNNGAGIFGANTAKGDIGIPGKYAGYFRGDVKVEDLLWAYQITESDINYKENIEEIDSYESVLGIMSLRPVKYDLKQRYLEAPTETKSDSTLIVTYFDESSQLLSKKKYGLIAQELKETYPDLVYESQNGDLGIDYTGLIPVLIKIIQTQQVKIEAVENEIKILKELRNENRY